MGDVGPAEGGVASPLTPPPKPPFSPLFCLCSSLLCSLDLVSTLSGGLLSLSPSSLSLWPLCLSPSLSDPTSFFLPSSTYSARASTNQPTLSPAPTPKPSLCVMWAWGEGACEWGGRRTEPPAPAHRGLRDGGKVPSPEWWGMGAQGQPCWEPGKEGWAGREVFPSGNAAHPATRQAGRWGREGVP